MYMLNMVIILIVMYCNVVTAIDKIPMYLLCFNRCTTKTDTVMDAQVVLFYFILSYLRTHDPERILPYVDRGTFIF